MLIASQDEQKINGKFDGAGTVSRWESNEPDYDEDVDQLEEEQEQEAGETRVTTNEVF